ncbi:MAG: methylmalonyl-CoA carboxyltransferase [Actinobacteria bacterium]|nr:methylmalonyl-CoA carboxyltransferase [Actinomycetota bacterium]
MSWSKELDELAVRKRLAQELGGAERVERHRSRGKLTVRDRIAGLLDDGSFREIGSVAGFATYSDDGSLETFTPANTLIGDGLIDGRPVVVTGDDFTVRGGSAEASIWAKFVHAEQRARSHRVPMIRLVDGSGGGGSVASYHALGRTYVPPLPGFADTVAALGEIPVAAAALGSVAGLGAARVALSHFSVMVDGISQMFTAGPPIVRYATHEDLDKEVLGGAAIHGSNGTIDNVVASEQEAFESIGRFLSYLPSNVWSAPERCESNDSADRRDDRLARIIPTNRRRPYDGRVIIDAVMDVDSFFEIGDRWGRELIGGLARLDGVPVGVLAADPQIGGGVLTADGSHKLRRLVDLCDTFRLPIVNFVDQPGFAIGSIAEERATLRHGVAAMAALYQMTVPYFAVIVRRTFGVAGAALVDATVPHDRVAWPSADWGSLPLEGGIEAAYRRDLEASDDPDALRAELVASFDAVRSPFRTAEAFDIEEIIDPLDTRAVLCRWVNRIYPNLSHSLGPKGRAYRP